MVKLTLIARARDGQILAEGLDADKENSLFDLKAQAKGLFKQFSAPGARPPARQTLASGKYAFHVLIEGGVVYVALTEEEYPRKLAFQYLEELSSEFGRLYGGQIESANRPYAFIKFDTFIQKTRKLYLDTRTQRNLTKLSAEIAEVHSIMTRNIADVLGQGERLDRMAAASANLSADARAFSVKSRDLYRQALIRKYAPWVIVGVILLLVLLARRWFY